MSQDQGTPRALEWTGERYLPEVAGNIRLEHVHRYLIARELSHGKHVLDIACGEGYGSAILADAATRVVGVDIAEDAVAHASARYQRPNLEFKQGACDAIPLPDQAVDVVVSFETIEHVDHHERVIDELHRVLRPGGLLIISTPDTRQYSGVLGNQNEYHVKELDRDGFEQLLRSRFRHVSMGGQRVGGGSIIGPLDEATGSRFVTFPSAAADAPGVPGVDAPVYLLALASNDPLPALPVGVVDGGPFAWASDLPALLAQVMGQCAAEIGRRVGREVQLDGASIETIREEFTRQAEHVSALVRAFHAQGHGELESARAQILALGAQLVALSEQLPQIAAQLVVAHSSLAKANEDLGRVNAVLAKERTERESLQSQLGASRAVSAGLELRQSEYVRAIDGLKARVAALQTQCDIYEHSQSWRLTAPLRSVRRGLARLEGGTRGIARRLRQPSAPFSTPGASSAGPASGGAGPSLPETVAVSAAVSASLPDPEDSDAPRDYVALDREAPVESRIKLIAFYLPQFHPTPENDAWWGRGFTEWRNVTRGRPQFAEHYQPHLPGELGFYDLRVLEVQRRQIELARLFGIHGFCYHHYWFGGRRLLRQPLDQLLAHPELDFPFCLCWANENWTRAWDGLDREVLIAQEHSPEDDLAFIRDIEPALRDPRYVRVAGRPLLIVYRPALLPDAAATAERWRAYCREAGLGELYLVSTYAFDHRDPREFGFDAAVEFAPNNMAGPGKVTDVTQVSPDFRGTLYDYRELVAINRDRPATGGPVFRCVTPMWDNEARRPSRGTVFVHSSPALYGEWLRHVCEWTDRHLGSESPLVFVNAWNEWAEGAHLEPDQRYGYAYLEATAQALEQFPAGPPSPSIVVVSHDAYFHGAQLVALNLARTLTTRLHYQVDVILCGPGPLTGEFDAVARVHDFSRPELTREAKSRVVEQLYQQGARIAICNTSVVGEAVELLKQAGFSVVSLIHELPGLIQAHGLEASVERIARHADRVVFPAKVVRDSFVSLTGLDPARSVIHPQGLFAPNEHFGQRESARRELRDQLGLPADTRVVLAVGYADHRKGIDLFADVGIRVAARMEDVVFVWVGHHEAAAFEAARAQVDRAGLNARFVFPGPVRNCDLFLAGADVYLMTSREDPFPNVVPQALDAELPVIGFEGAGGFVELLERGCGALVPFADTEAMAETLLRLLRSPDEGARLAGVARETLARDFSFVNYARTLVELVGPAALKVSAVVPNFNYARYLPARLDSIVKQTYPPHEILFLDDCSSDDSVAVAARILHASGLSYRIIRNETNQGTYRQWLRGIREAAGDLIWIAEADDDCEPTLLARLVAPFDRPEVVLSYCQSRQIDEAGREIAANYLAYTADISETKWNDDYVRPGLDEIRDTLVVKNTVPNVSAVVMRKPDLSRVESRLHGLRNAGDWLLYVDLLTQGDIAFVAEPLNAHRRHSGSVTIGRGGLNLMREIVMVQQYILERYDITPETAAKLEANLQATYEYLGLHQDGPPSYKDHDALKVIEWATVG